MEINPVISSAHHVHKSTGIVTLNGVGIKAAASYIKSQMRSTSYTPSTWRFHPLHLVPSAPYAPAEKRTKECLDWIFFISALNFSFWSDLPENSRYAVEWYTDGWNALEKPEDERPRKAWTGYWSLLAATNKALESGIPITNPRFYSSRSKCPDALLASVFAPASSAAEPVPLLSERVRILREVGAILCKHFAGSYQGLLRAFQRDGGRGRTALVLVKTIVEMFPSFRDECVCEGKKVYFWKRAQILVAETWAAFYPYPAHGSTPHPFFPHGISQLTMFADYRVPQILHRLKIITYPPRLLSLLYSRTPLESGSDEEMSIRAASILGVERVKEAIQLQEGTRCGSDEVTSVLIDFWLWDMAKELEKGDIELDFVEGGEASVPIHRTRGIWY